MQTFFINAFFVLAAFIAMEAIAWTVHKYIMHGLLWILHKDHHKKESPGFFEHNDFFFLIFAIPGIVLLFIGSKQDYNYLFWLGTGVTLYGAAYFLVHDIFIHQRFKWLRNSNFIYFQALRRAHKMHHKHVGKDEGECFGMLWIPFKFYKQVRKK